MTKRVSPFEPYICRQLKVHVNNYEKDFNALKEVEERTLKKLIEGSRNFKFNLNQNQFENMSLMDNKEVNRNYLQKCLTNYFTVNGKIVYEKVTLFDEMHPEIYSKWLKGWKSLSAKIIQENVGFLKSGRKNGYKASKSLEVQENEDKCSFCDIKTTRTYQCVKCFEFYCSRCCLSNYEKFEDKKICLSCS